MSAERRRRILIAAAGLGGLALFAWAVDRAGVGEIVQAVRRVGWGLIPVLALGGLRFVLRAEAWRLCTPPRARLTFWDTFAAFLAGDALGNVTPFGPVASEPTKMVLIRHRLATRESVSSLAVDNFVYAGSVLLVIGLGVVALLATVPLSFEAREWGVAALVTLAGAGIAGVMALRGWWSSTAGERPPWRQRLAGIRQSALEFSAGHPSRLWRVFAVDLGFHALAVLETFLVLQWILQDRTATFTDALLFQSLNRAIVVVFKIVPFQIGVDEALSGAFAPVLAIQPVAGVALAVVRKVRTLFWSGIGLALIAAHHGRAAPPETDRHESASARRS